MSLYLYDSEGINKGVVSVLFWKSGVYQRPIDLTLSGEDLGQKVATQVEMKREAQAPYNKILEGAYAKKGLWPVRPAKSVRKSLMEILR